MGEGTDPGKFAQSRHLILGANLGIEIRIDSCQVNHKYMDQGKGGGKEHLQQVIFSSPLEDTLSLADTASTDGDPIGTTGRNQRNHQPTWGELW